MRRSTCLRCDTPLEPYAHWGICPNCDPSFLKGIRLPSIADQVAAKGLAQIRDVGIPQRGN